ncbi:MAG: cupin domain-containing protein [Deltaproteobacteria bacterium]|nr:cupin domain-containing protein [Deltaproteobacteria bacterium]
MNELNAKLIIQKLRLEPHREGGYCRETYRCSEKLNTTEKPGDQKKNRSLCSAIYYLLTEGQFSAFHRISQDEIWHYYAGDPIRHIQISPDGELTDTVLGPDLLADQVPQLLVTASSWQGCMLIEEGEWALVGCTVAPGFEFSDFELAKRDKLLRLFPQHQALIKKLTRT